MDLLLIEFHKAGLVLEDEGEAHLDDRTKNAWIDKRRKLEAKGEVCSAWSAGTYRDGVKASQDSTFCQLPKNHDGPCLMGPRNLEIITTMTIEEVKRRIKQIEAVASDPEAAHALRDRLYRDVLDDISNDCEYSKELAEAALAAEGIPLAWEACA